MIIVEGPDGSGKSTLAKRISYDLNLESYHLGGPPSTRVETLNRAIRSIQRLTEPCVQDRTTLISECVYGWALRDKGSYLEWSDVSQILRALNPVVVYCRVPTDRLRPVSKFYDTEQYETELANHFNAIVQRYDKCFTHLDCVKTDFNYTSPNADFHYQSLLEICKMKIAIGR
jgi:GTPase SAR1 family protein